MPLRRVALTAAVVAAVALAGCGGGGQAGGGGEETYQIGIFAPKTGYAAADGLSALTGAKLAVQQVNESGGVHGKKVELTIYDDHSEPDQAATVARKLVQQDQVDVVVSGSYSPMTLAAAPVVARLGNVMIAAYAVDPEITQVGEAIWRIGELATIQGKVGGWLVLEKLDAQRIAILEVDNSYGSSLAKAFSEYVTARGAKIVYDTKYPLSETDYRPLLSTIKQRDPDVIYATGYYSNAAKILKQAETLGVDAQIVGVEGYDSFKLIQLAGKAANDVIFTTELNRDSKRDVVQRFLADYKEFTGGRPADAVAAETYDATRVAIEALRMADSRDDIIAALRQMEDFSFSVTNIMRFDNHRNAIRPGLAQIVKNKEIRFYASIGDPAIITMNY